MLPARAPGAPPRSPGSRTRTSGDGDDLVHHVYVEDVASALRVVAEEGTPGEAYNVGARRLLTIDRRLELVAAALGRSVELVHACERELARFDLVPTDFPLVREVPVVVDCEKLAALGWESTAHAEAIAATVDEDLRSDRTGRHLGPDGEAERRAVEGLAR